MSLAKVEGFSNLQKDTSAGGVVNVDKRAYENYIATRNALRLQKVEAECAKETVDNLSREINNIKDDLKDIKQILMSLINNR